MTEVLLKLTFDALSLLSLLSLFYWGEFDASFVGSRIQSFTVKECIIKLCHKVLRFQVIEV